MANARPSTWNTVMASHGRPLTRRDKLSGSCPAIVIDKDLIEVVYVVHHGSGTHHHYSLAQAQEKGLIEVVRSGFDTEVYIKRNAVSVRLRPSEMVIRKSI